KVKGRILRGEDNKMSLEEFREVLNKPECPGSLTFVESYFSQAEQVLNLSASVNLSEDLVVEVMDMNGRKAARQQFQTGDAAANRWKWELESLKPGLYIVRITLPSGYQKVQKILIQQPY
ncbi:MAG: T9SS type A sorting domain-containing protein, partial [Bacteroidota bacterium]